MYFPKDETDVTQIKHLNIIKKYNIQTESYYQIVVLGKGMVGKTSLIFKYLNKGDLNDRNPSMDESSMPILIKTNKGEEKEFKIFDTVEDEEYPNMLEDWICNANGFILVFAINDNESFENIKNLYNKIKSNNMDKNPIVLVGNKNDLEDERKVKKQEAQDYAKLIGAHYYETNVLNDENGNCKNIFQDCANRIADKANADSGQESKCIKCSII